MKLSKNECAIVVTKVLNGFILEMYDANSNRLFKVVASDASMRGYNMDSLCSAFEMCWQELDKIIAEQQPKVAPVAVPVEITTKPSTWNDIKDLAVINTQTGKELVESYGN